MEWGGSMNRPCTRWGVVGTGWSRRIGGFRAGRAHVGSGSGDVLVLVCIVHCL